MQILQLLISLSLLVVIHEMGHFIFARIFGVRVERFSLFFGKPLLRFKPKRSETEFVVGWLPFGGYVEIAGMVDESLNMEQLKQVLVQLFQVGLLEQFNYLYIMALAGLEIIGVILLILMLRVIMSMK